MYWFTQTAYAAQDGISIHLAPSVLGTLFGIPITNTLLTVWFVMALLFFAMMISYTKIRMIPGRFQVAVEALVGGTYDQVVSTLGSEKYGRRFFPLIMTIFIFVLAINWIGLLPGVGAFGFLYEYLGEEKMIPFLYPANTDLNITFAFALIAFATVELSGIFILGFWKYGSKFINLKMFKNFTGENVLGFFIGLIELFSEIARLISFAFRLFGNIFAGKTLLLVVIFFVPYVFPVPILAFEIFVGFIQAFIFAVLTLFFVKLAIEEPH